MRGISNTMMCTGVMGLFLGASAADGTALPLVLIILAVSAVLMLAGAALSPEH